MSKKSIICNKIVNVKNLTILFYILFLLIGCVCVKDYGVSCDEPIQRQHYLINSKYLYQFFLGEDHIPSALQSQADLKDYTWKYYGVSIRLPLFLIEAFHNFELSNRDIYYITHTYNFLLFFVAAIYIRRILKLLDFSEVYCLVGTILFTICPRIFADSFYNIKDSVFLSLFTVMLFYGLAFVEKSTIRRAVGLIISAALAVNCRVVAGLPLVIIALFYIFKDFKLNNKRLINVIMIMISSIISYFIITPASWESPFEYIQGVLTTFSDFTSWHSTIGLINTVYDSAKLPWFYTVLCMIITLPTIYTALSTVGVFEHFFCLFRSENMRERLHKNYLLYIVLAQFIIILLSDMIISPTKYNLWRHMYFMYSYLVIMSIYGLKTLIDMTQTPGRKRYRWLIIVFVGLSISQTAIWMIANHPFEYLYFNPIYATSAKELTERDYWNTSGQNMLSALAEKNEEGFYDVWADLPTASLFFGEKGWEAFRTNSQENGAQYSIKYYSDKMNSILYDVVDILEVSGRESTYLLRRKNFDNCVARFLISEENNIIRGTGNAEEIDIKVTSKEERKEIFFLIPENQMAEEIDILFPSDKSYYEDLEVLYSSDGKDWYVGGTNTYQSKEMVSILFNKNIKYLKIIFDARYETNIGISVFGKNGISPKEIDASENFYTCGYMVDNDTSTRYSSGKPMEAGMTITCSFASSQSLKGIGINYGENTNDYSRDMTVYIPDENGDWKEICHTINDNSNYISFNEPVYTNQIRLVNNHTDESYYWSIAELQFFEYYKISYPDTCSRISNIITSTDNSSYLLDNDPNTVWKSDDNGVKEKCNIDIEIIDNEPILGFYLNSSHAPLKAALNATIFGSYDGTTWNEIDYRYGSQQDYVFDSPKTYKFYRIENEENGSNDLWEVSEIRILEGY